MSLSILIPARNEEFFQETLLDLLKNIRGETDIFVVLDGEWVDKELPKHPIITYIYRHEPWGQRRATNEMCRLSRAKYVMKVDAHCAFDEGFDVKMVEAMRELGSDVTMVPTMKNLHVFDWVCANGHRRYQGPSGPCEVCGEPTQKDIVWIPKKAPNSIAYRFDTEMHFQYFNEFKKRPEAQRDYVETMSLQGSCFMLARDRYWDLNICDEEYGSWGAQGTEVACKSWLSGGRCIVNRKTWYAHLFRTKGDFAFPYKQDNKQVAAARRRSQVMFLDNTWEKQVRPLSWLIDKFAPVPDWHDGTDNGMLEKVRKQPVMI